MIITVITMLNVKTPLVPSIVFVSLDSVVMEPHVVVSILLIITWAIHLLFF